VSVLANLSRRSMLLGACSTLAALGSPRLLLSAGLSPKLTGPLSNSSKGLLVWDVSGQGYVAEEFLLNGLADVYESVSMADAMDTNTRDNVADQARRTFALKTVASAQPYATRLVVYRPATAARFSGNVIVEATHPLGGGANLVWRDINSFFTARGDVYVAVQHPATLAGLAQADPSRYPLHSQHHSQLWGMLADTGRLLKGGSNSRLLSGLKPKRLYMTGYSFTGVTTATFADYHHDRTRLANGEPVFDGYIPMANAMYVKPLDVPVIRINTQSDFDSFGALKNRAPSSDAAIGRFRHYEVAGAAHVWTERPQPNEAKPYQGTPVAPAQGQPRIDAPACMSAFPQGFKPNDVPLNLVMTQAFQNLSVWVEHGTSPPPSALIDTDAAGKTLLDGHGNALGGLRLPEVEVPIATFGVGSGDVCFLFGYRMPFELAKRKQLYGSKDAYVAKVTVVANQLAERRLIQAQGAAELAQRAAQSEDF
jgi:Alpha/beta hydrolase domain